MNTKTIILSFTGINPKAIISGAIKLLCCAFTLVFININISAQTGGAAINSSGSPADPSAILDVSSTTQGILVPRMTETERLAMPNLSNGLLVYQTDGTSGFWYYNGGYWIQFPSVGNAMGDMQYWDGTKWVIVPAGSEGEYLQFTSSGYPQWVTSTPWAGGVLASITTNEVQGITNDYSMASTGGTVTNSGGTTITDYGVCWSTSPNPTIADNITWDGSGTGSFTFSSSMTGLALSTTYYVRAYATNTAGISYGNEITYTTADGIPTITTAEVSTIGSTYAILGGNLVSYGGASITFDPDFGVCWSTSPNPTVADNTSHTAGYLNDVYLTSATGLMPGTEYFVRAYAIANTGTFYGNEVSFTTAADFTIAIGETYQGGIIFYIDGSGEHGLVAAPTNQGSGLSWGCNATFVGASGTAVGTGQANTLAAVNNCGQSGIPAKLCNDLVLDGYSDWFLPSKDELNLFFTNLYYINNLNGSYFWSSSEGSCSCAGNAGAWYQYCPNIGCGSVANKGSQLKVRAVRVF